MPQWRVSFQFQNALSASSTAGSLYGWTENWYYATSVTNNQIIAAAAAWVAARVPLLTPGWRITRARFAVFPSTRSAFTVNYPAGNGTGTLPAAVAAVPDEQPYDVIVMNAVTALGGQKNFALGGIGSDFVTAGGIFNSLSPGWNANFPAFQAVLAGGWAARRFTPVVNATKIPVVAIWTAPNVAIPPAFAPSPTRPVVQFFPGPAGFPAVVQGQPIRISQVKGEFNVNGLWTLAGPVQTLGTFDWLWLQQRRNSAVTGTWLDGGFFTVGTYTLDAITGCTPSRGSSRKRGGAPGRPRGRRSTRRS